MAVTQTEVCASNTAAVNSVDITIDAGVTRVFTATDPGHNLQCEVRRKIGAGYLLHDRFGRGTDRGFSLAVTGPAVVQVHKPLTAVAASVYMDA